MSEILTRANCPWLPETVNDKNGKPQKLLAVVVDQEVMDEWLQALMWDRQEPTNPVILMFVEAT